MATHDARSWKWSRNNVKHLLQKHHKKSL